MKVLRQLWQVLTCAPPPLPAWARSCAPLPVQPKPPRPPFGSREELELTLLLSWLPEAERPRCVALLAQRASRHFPWSEDDLWGEPWEQCQQWGPLEIKEPETMSVEGFGGLLEVEVTAGLYTFCTPLSVLSRPVRMLWLLRQSRRAGQIYAGLKVALGSQQRALEYARSVIARL